MMNELIEQLGGYEASKNILLRKRYDHVSYSVDSDSFYDHEATEHGAIDIQELDDALLEYRRANNIFEVGDDVLIKDCDVLDVFKIEGLHKVDGGGFTSPKYVINVATLSGYGKAISVNWLVHATDAEIEAGHRL